MYAPASTDPSAFTNEVDGPAVDEITPDPLFFKTPGVVSKDIVNAGAVTVSVNTGLANGALEVSMGWTCPPSDHLPCPPNAATPFMTGRTVAVAGMSLTSAN